MCRLVKDFYLEKQAELEVAEADEVLQLMEYDSLNINEDSLINLSETENGVLSRRERTPEYDILSSVRLAAAREKAARERGFMQNLELIYNL